MINYVSSFWFSVKMLHFYSIIYQVVGELKGRKMMNEKENKKYYTIQKLINKEMTIKEAMF